MEGGSWYELYVSGPHMEETCGGRVSGAYNRNHSYYMSQSMEETGPFCEDGCLVCLNKTVLVVCLQPCAEFVPFTVPRQLHLPQCHSSRLKNVLRYI
jgi:hypothetical protein